MIIENLEITKLYYTMRNNGDKKDVETAYKLIKWQSKKTSTNGTIEETNPEIIARYTALRDQWIGGPILLVYKSDCVKIAKAFQDDIVDVFQADHEKGRALIAEWGSRWYSWYKTAQNKFITAKECQIVDKDVYDMVQYYKTKYIGGTKDVEDCYIEERLSKSIK